MPARHALARFALATVVCLSLVGCTGTPAPTGTTAPSAAASIPAPTGTTAPGTAAPGASGPLVTVERRGGECAAATCDTTITIERSGRMHVSAKPPNELGIATPMQVAALQAAIDATDFAALRMPAFTGECPVNYDGQELVFTFATGHGDERLATCESAVDLGAPVFAALAAALGTNAPFTVP